MKESDMNARWEIEKIKNSYLFQSDEERAKYQVLNQQERPSDYFNQTFNYSSEEKLIADGTKRMKVVSRSTSHLILFIPQHNIATILSPVFTHVMNYWTPILLGSNDMLLQHNRRDYCSHIGYFCSVIHHFKLSIVQFFIALQIDNITDSMKLKLPIIRFLQYELMRPDTCN